MQEVSIAILNFNGRDYLKQFLPSVITFSEGHEIIVIDNASTDDSVKLLRIDFPQIRVIQLNKNLGFSGGYNEGLKKINAEFVVLLNSDIEVTANWVDGVITYMKTDTSIAACQPKILDFKNKNRFEYAGASGGFIDILGYPFCRGRVFQSIEEDKGQYDTPQEVFWATGACLFVRRDEYFKVGGLDEDFFAHMEEIDLCWRFWNHGYKVAVCPESTVYHVGGGTLAHGHPRKTYLNFRNGLSLLLKNESIKNLLWKIPLRIFLDWVAAIQFSFVSGPTHGWAILKAHLHFLFYAKKMLSRRQSVMRKERINTHYKGFLVWDYFIKRKKKYSEIVR